MILEAFHKNSIHRQNNIERNRRLFDAKGREKVSGTARIVINTVSSGVQSRVYVAGPAGAPREGRRSVQRRRKRGEERDRAVKPLPCTPSPWTEWIPPIVQQDPPPKVREDPRPTCAADGPCTLLR